MNSLFSLEEFINGDLLVKGRFVDASNATLFGEVVQASGMTIPVVYKPIAGERPLWDFPAGTLAFRERSAYLIDSWAGLNRVPLTVLRDGPYGRGSVQLWLEVDEDIDVIEIGHSDNHDVRSIALLDLIINNADRKFGHLLPVSAEDIFACDHGVTFHHEDKLRTVLWQFTGAQFTADEVATLENLLTRLDQPEANELHELITMEEKVALISRIHRLIENGLFPEPEIGRPAIPWPPV